ncbi:MAG TPA: SRPBCC family protein [Bryobacteraceae bacterium]|nr:SRPBCC family protein [Bryobacteraceae bacterium]
MAAAQQMSTQQLANSLGWFSIGLGLAELATPNVVAKLIGARNGAGTRNILRFYGARELAAGVGILSQSNPSGWLWARVAGDVVDVSSLCKAMLSDGNDRGKSIAATAAVLGVTVADVCCAMRFAGASANGQARRRAAAIISSITIARTAEEIYSFWRDFARLPEIFDRLESVQALDDNRWRWKLAMPMSRSLEWDAEITDDQPNSRIAWQSVSPSVPHSGEVRFEPSAGQRGTKVTVRIQPQLASPGIAKLLGVVPEQHVNIALHNLKQMMETGEVVKSDASIHRGMHAAVPSETYSGSGQRAAIVA